MTTCQICKKEFTERGLTYHITHIHKITKKDYYDKYLKTENEGLCKYCGNQTKFYNNYYAVYCSNKCACLDKYGVENNLQIPEVKAKAHSKEAHQKAANSHNYEEVFKKGRQTKLEKYGNENYHNIDKAKETKLIKYGDPNFNNRKKASQTSLERYGTINPMQSIGKETFRQHNLEQYGVGSIFQVPEIIEKSKQTKLERYNDENYNNREKAKLTCIDRYNVENPMQCKDIQKKALSHTRSKSENIIVEFIKSFYDKEIIINTRKVLKKYELDIYLPDIKLAIEYNGIRYHSIELYKPKDRILKKSLLCRNKNIRLIHIYEFEDLNKQLKLLKSLILGEDKYNKEDFNKNNLIINVPKPEIVYKDDNYTVYGAGKLRVY